MKSARAHRTSSSYKVVNTTSIHHFVFLLLLGFVRFHVRKAIFGGALKMKLFCAFLGILLLSGCISHAFLDGEVRLQIENESSVSIARLVVLSDKGTEKVWIADTLAPGEKSGVVSGSWVGTFDLGVSFQDSVSGTWKKVIFSSVSLEGGSLFAKISQKDGEWTFNIK